MEEGAALAVGAQMAYNALRRNAMETKILEMEGTAEEIQARLSEFAGQRIRATITQATDKTEPVLPKKSITEELMGLFNDMPPEERGKLPTDLSENLDHYLYGWPKK